MLSSTKSRTTITRNFKFELTNIRNTIAWWDTSWNGAHEQKQKRNKTELKTNTTGSVSDIEYVIWSRGGKKIMCLRNEYLFFIVVVWFFLLSAFQHEKYFLWKRYWEKKRKKRKKQQKADIKKRFAIPTLSRCYHKMDDVYTQFMGKCLKYRRKMISSTNERAFPKNTTTTDDDDDDSWRWRRRSKKQECERKVETVFNAKRRKPFYCNMLKIITSLLAMEVFYLYFPFFWKIFRS